MIVMKSLFLALNNWCLLCSKKEKHYSIATASVLYSFIIVMCKFLFNFLRQVLFFTPDPSSLACDWRSAGTIAGSACMLQWEKPVWLRVTAAPSQHHLCMTWLWPWSSVSILTHPECLVASALALELLHCNRLAFVPAWYFDHAPFSFLFSESDPWMWLL